MKAYGRKVGERMFMQSEGSTSKEAVAQKHGTVMIMQKEKGKRSETY